MEKINIEIPEESFQKFTIESDPLDRLLIIVSGQFPILGGEMKDFYLSITREYLDPKHKDDVVPDAKVWLRDKFIKAIEDGYWSTSRERSEIDLSRISETSFYAECNDKISERVETIREIYKIRKVLKNKRKEAMENYIGTKQIKAKPMNRLDYNIYRGWELPSDEDGNDEGYLVEYIDGGQSNHKGHDGYISWSPNEVFEKSYRKNGTFIERVVIERDDLLVKVEALESALSAELVPALEINILERQLSSMTDYLQILDIRIKRANK